jgi:broad specificity phosphatase PhoE
MLELLLIRHGQTDYNAKRLVMGRQPIPLNDVGLRQAEELSRKLEGADIHAVITSPVLRAKQTAERIAKSCGGIDVEEAAGLAELDYGDWVNRDIDEIIAENPGEWKKYRTRPEAMGFPGGESIADASKRVGAFAEGVARRYEGGRVALVSHADVIKIALVHLLGLELRYMARLSVDNCAVCMLRMTEKNGPRLVMLSCTDSLNLKGESVDAEVRP